MFKAIGYFSQAASWVSQVDINSFITYEFLHLTHDVCAEGHCLHLPTIVVEGQVPGASIQVLDKHCLIEDHSLNASPFTRRLNDAPLLLPVQALHIIILKEREVEKAQS